MKVFYSEPGMRTYQPRHRRPVLRLPRKKITQAAAVAVVSAVAGRVGAPPKFSSARTKPQ